jgi:hypothetical protein
MSMHRSCFPPEALLHTGRLRSAGSELPTSSPASSLVCSPPTSSLPSAAAPVPLAGGLPRYGRFSDPATCAPVYTWRAGDGLPALQGPETIEEKQGSPRLLGRPLRTRHGRPSRRIRSPIRPSFPYFREVLSGKTSWSSARFEAWTSGSLLFSGPHSRGSYARVPTLRRPRYRDRRKAHYRLGGLALGRAGFAPAGRHIEVS